MSRLWDIQNTEIPAYGTKLVDVEIAGEDSSETAQGCLKMDVSDIGKNVASMGPLLRASKL